MDKTEQLVRKAIDSGQMTQKEHDRLMDLVSRDGTIDERETALLSEVFSAVRAGTLTILDSDGHQSRTAADVRKLDEYKGEALQRQSLRQQRIEPESTPTAENASEDLAEDEPFGYSDKTEHPTRTAGGPSAGSSSATDCALTALASQAKVRRENGPLFTLHNDRLLDVQLQGKVWMKSGAMIAYFGNVKFTREGILEHGLKKLVKKAVTGEGAILTKATGVGNLYLADQGKKIFVIDLEGQSITVNGESLLAFQEGISWDITLLKQIAAIWAGGLFNVRLNGCGTVAITTHFDPVVLRVSPGEPLMTDAHATVAWSGGLVPQLKTDISSNTLIGRTSGETFQMRFEGDGFVVLQPFERLPEGPPTKE